MPNVLTITYEELLMDLADESLDVYYRIAEYLSVYDRDVVGQMVRSVKPKDSHTFRSGRIGGWREAFDKQTKKHWEDNFGWLWEDMSSLAEGGSGWRI